MKLRVRALQIRVQAEKGLYGCDLKLDDGLVLIRAENSKGKSTCLMSILYALGLEGMLGASHQVPLQPVLLSEIGTEQGDQKVIHSYVRVEIEGAHGVVTVRRTAAGDANAQKRISVVHGPDLTAPSTEYRTKDYFVRMKGDADSEHGFHAFLAQFVGWKLPMLSRFDGTRTVLYLACLAPYFFVDQLSGWRDIKARMPTYLQIPEMARRSAEYILSLDILRIAIANIQLREEEEVLRKRWSDIRQRFLSSLPRIGIVPRGLSEAMPQNTSSVQTPSLLVSVNEKWIPVEEHENVVKRRAAELAQEAIPETKDVSANAVADLERLETQLQRLMLRLEERQVEARLAKDQVAAIEKRLADLREDYRQLDDDRRLRDRGGKLSLKSADNSCPTCGQHITGLLLAHDSPVRPMALDENIAFLRDQIATFREMHADAVRTTEGKGKAAQALSSEVETVSAQVRAQKELLRSGSNSPSVANIQERLGLQSRLVQLEQVRAAREELNQQLEAFKIDLTALLDAKKRTGEERLTESDRSKLEVFERLFLSQLREYGFESYRVERLSISTLTYRPSNEGVDLGITSASDAVRVVWAYLVGLLELARVVDTNHPGILIFDEPKQQMVRGVSFEALMRRACDAANFGQQVIFGTSQPVEEIERMLDGQRYQLLNYGDEKIIKQIADPSP